MVVRRGLPGLVETAPNIWKRDCVCVCVCDPICANKSIFLFVLFVFLSFLHFSRFRPIGASVCPFYLLLCQLSPESHSSITGPQLEMMKTHTKTDPNSQRLQNKRSSGFHSGLFIPSLPFLRLAWINSSLSFFPPKIHILFLLFLTARLLTSDLYFCCSS